MSTRCNVAVVGGGYEVLLYRHCDGLPVNMKWDLDQIVIWLKEERIPQHPAAVASWLILLGIDCNLFSFKVIDRNKETNKIEPSIYSQQDPTISPSLYLITDTIHSDIDFFYAVDTEHKCWRGYGCLRYGVDDGRAGFLEARSWHNVRFNKGAPHPDGSGFSSKTAEEYQDKVFNAAFN